MIFTYSNDIRKKLSIEEIEKCKKLIEKGEGDNMTNFEKLFIELIDDKRKREKEAEEKAMKRGMKRGVQQGIQKGIREGITQSINKIVKEMLKKDMSDDIIMDTTKIKKEELQKLKQELKVC